MKKLIIALLASTFSFSAMADGHAEWWKAAGAPYKGVTLQGITENTPPGNFAADVLAKDFEEVLAEEAPVITTSTSENDFAPVHPIDPYADSGRLHNVERRSVSAGLMSTSETSVRRSQIKKKGPSRSQMSINYRMSRQVIMPIVRESEDESEEEEPFGW